MWSNLDSNEEETQDAQADETQNEQDQKDTTVDQECSIPEQTPAVKYDNPYTYDFLLERVNEIIKKNNTYSTLNKDFHVKQFILEKASTRKFYWKKFKDFCSSLNRTPEHFSSFVSAELGILVLLAEDKLVMEGRKIDQNKVLEITKRYVSRF